MSKKKTTHADFSEVFATQVTDKQISDKVEFLDRLFRMMQRDGRFPHHRLCLRTAAHLAHSYFHDVIRYRWYNNMLDERINSPKQAAFLIKWILKLRPVVLIDNSRKTVKAFSTHDYFGNELLSLRVATTLTKIKNIDVHFDDESVSRILYTMRYRNLREAGLLLWLETLAHSSRIYAGMKAEKDGSTGTH